MKKLFFLFVICLFCGAGLYYVAARTPGYLLLVIGNLSIEMSIWFALAVLLVSLLLLWLIVHSIRGGARGVGRQLGRLVSGSTRGAQRKQAMGFIHFFEGNWSQARKLLSKSAPSSPNPLLNYLGAARSAYELGDVEQANALLSRAEQEGSEAQLSVILAQARMQFAANRFEQCAATLERGRKLAADNPVVLDLLSKVYLQLQDWSNLEQILPQLQRHGLKDQAEITQIASTVYQQLLRRAGSRGSLDEIRSYWQKIPRQFHSDTEVLLVYVDLLEAGKAVDEAELVLRRALDKHWQSSWVIRYGTLRGKDPMQQLARGEHWLRERPADADLLLTLGRLCLMNELWGKARDYFEKSLKVTASPATYAEIARLLAHLGEHRRSTEYYQKGLLLAAQRLPDLPMPEPRDMQVPTPLSQ